MRWLKPNPRRWIVAATIGALPFSLAQGSDRLSGSALKTLLPGKEWGRVWDKRDSDVPTITLKINEDGTMYEFRSQTRHPGKMGFATIHQWRITDDQYCTNDLFAVDEQSEERCYAIFQDQENYIFKNSRSGHEEIWEASTAPAFNWQPLTQADLEEILPDAILEPGQHDSGELVHHFKRDHGVLVERPANASQFELGWITNAQDQLCLYPFEDSQFKECFHTRMARDVMVFIIPQTGQPRHLWIVRKP